MMVVSRSSKPSRSPIGSRPANQRLASDSVMTATRAPDTSDEVNSRPRTSGLPMVAK
jgi:hypothetical protein